MATATQEKISPEGCACPYWSALTCSCLLVSDGLFIPLKHHVTLYCSSSRFLVCPHYQRLAVAKNQNESDQEKPANHRRSIRIPAYHNFHFSKIIDNHLFKIRANNTWTFDFSEHGLCFASEQLLARDTAIRFFIEENETVATTEGVGKVVWCAPLKNTSFFQVGIAITWLFK